MAVDQTAVFKKGGGLGRNFAPTLQLAPIHLSPRHGHPFTNGPKGSMSGSLLEVISAHFGRISSQTDCLPRR
jgi:hypothetical protein